MITYALVALSALFLAGAWWLHSEAVRNFAAAERNFAAAVGLLVDAQRATLLNLAAWVETEFKLANRPKVTERTAADRIYSEILRRLGELPTTGTQGHAQ